MNPLSTWTHYRRQRRNALVLTLLISLTTAGLLTMLSILDSITLTRAHVSYLT